MGAYKKESKFLFGSGRSILIHFVHFWFKSQSSLTVHLRELYCVSEKYKKLDFWS